MSDFKVGDKVRLKADQYEEFDYPGADFVPEEVYKVVRVEDYDTGESPMLFFDREAYQGMDDGWYAYRFERVEESETEPETVPEVETVPDHGWRTIDMEAWEVDAVPWETLGLEYRIQIRTKP